MIRSGFRLCLSYATRKLKKKDYFWLLRQKIPKLIRRSCLVLLISMQSDFSADLGYKSSEEAVESSGKR